MKNIFKLYGVSDTNSGNSTFSKTRLKLTIFYALSIFIILVIFSIATYIVFERISRNTLEFEDKKDLADVEQVTTERMIDRLGLIFIISDSAVLIISAFLGYYLAGKTLLPIQEAMEKQKRFVADSAHELRTPLSIMKTGIETTTSAKKQTIDDYKDLNKDLLSEINELINLSNNLLFLANTDSKKQNMIFKKINISSLCLNQVKFIEQYAQEKDITISTEVNKDYFIIGNTELFNRMIINLLKNSIDYSNKGGSMLISIEQLNNNIFLKISDSGIGIPSEDLKHVFERFYKADKSRNVNGSGTGLGLSIVQEIVKLHNGLIHVESEVDKGTTVTIILKSA
jgi:two-component system, OmpR family, sensor histidine kinase CiaH